MSPTATYRIDKYIAFDEIKYIAFCLAKHIAFMVLSLCENITPQNAEYQQFGDIGALIIFIIVSFL